jgi:peptidoglycan-associated lipoprotein
MKKTSLFSIAILGAVLAFGVVGCQHGPQGITKIPGQSKPISDPGTGIALPPDTTGTDITGSHPLDAKSLYTTMKESGNFTSDRGILEAKTVYFDTDSATIKKSEQSKLQEVADYIKANPNNAVEVEGHCDERGTEGYNQTLGNKRAHAVREYLINLGADGGHIGPVSLGESKPADPGHTEAAFAKNRRGVFVVMIPK